MKCGVDSSNEIGGGLKAEGRPVKGTLLPLVHADKIDVTDRSQIVSSRHSQDGGRCDGKEPLLFESGGYLALSAAEERLRVEEGDLAQVIGDGVVHSSFQAPAS